MSDIPSASLNPTQSGGFDARKNAAQVNLVPEQLAALSTGLSALGRGVSDVDAEQQRHQQMLQREYDSAKTTELTLKLNEAVRGELTTYLQTIGRDATDKRQATLDALEKHFEAISKGAANPEQQQRLARNAAQLLTSAIGDIDNHQTAQLRVWNIGVKEAATSEALRKFAFQFEKDGHVQTPEVTAAREGVLRASDELGEITGRPADSPQGKERRAQALGAVHDLAVTQLARANRPDMLREYVTEHGEDLPPAVREKALGVLADQEPKAVAIRTAISLDGRPYGERLAELDRMFKEGKLTTEEYEKSAQVVDQREVRRSANESRATNDVRQQAVALLDEHRRVARDSGDFAQGTVDDILPGDLLQQVKTLGLYGDLERYASRERMHTVPEGHRLLLEATRNPAQLRGVPWEVLQNSMWSMLDASDMERLGAVWATANAEEKLPRGAGNGGGGVTTYFMEKGKVFDFYTDKLIGPLPENPTDEDMRVRREAQLRLENLVRDAAATAKDKFDAHQFLRAYVAGEERKLVFDKTLGRTVPEFMARIPAPGSAEFEDFQGLAVDVRVPGADTPIRVEYAELARGDTMKRVIEHLEAQKAKAQKAGDASEVERLSGIIESRSQFELATEYGRLKGMSEYLQRVNRANDAARFGKAWWQEKQKAEDEALEPRWQEYLKLLGASPSMVPGVRQVQRYFFVGRERQRQDAASRWPNDPRFRFDVWHGLNTVENLQEQERKGKLHKTLREQDELARKLGLLPPDHGDTPTNSSAPR